MIFTSINKWKAVKSLNESHTNRTAINDLADVDIVKNRIIEDLERALDSAFDESIFDIRSVLGDVMFSLPTRQVETNNESIQEIASLNNMMPAEIASIITKSLQAMDVTLFEGSAKPLADNDIEAFYKIAKMSETITELSEMLAGDSDPIEKFFTFKSSDNEDVRVFIDGGEVAMEISDEQSALPDVSDVSLDTFSHFVDVEHTSNENESLVNEAGSAEFNQKLDIAKSKGVEVIDTMKRALGTGTTARVVIYEVQVGNNVIGECFTMDAAKELEAAHNKLDKKALQYPTKIGKGMGFLYEEELDKMIATGAFNESVMKNETGRIMLQSYNKKQQNTGWMTVEMSKDSMGDAVISFHNMSTAAQGLKYDEVKALIAYLQDNLSKLEAPLNTEGVSPSTNEAKAEGADAKKALASIKGLARVHAVKGMKAAVDGDSVKVEWKNQEHIDLKEFKDLVAKKKITCKIKYTTAE